jgi:hypothetical protein
MATDQSVLRHIKELTDEEHRLYEKGNLTDVEKKRIADINIALDQYWDLIRQRRALREYGRDPSEADTRSVSMVERYKG